MENNAEQPAYPGLDTNNREGHLILELRYTGLTKRELIAAMAMQGVLSDVHVQLWMKTDPRYNGDNFAQVVAINSCEFADALLSQLQSKP